MTSKEALKEFYKIVADNVIDKIEGLYESTKAIQFWIERYYTIEKDLDRLEKLEKTIELLKTRVKMFEIHHEPKSRYYYLYIGGRIVFLSREEYELLKEVLENGL